MEKDCGKLMYSTWKKVALIILLAISFISLMNISICTISNNLKQSDQSTGLIDHDPILIYDGSELLEMANSEGWLGDGTKNYPFIIEGYRINFTKHAFYIQYSNYYVIFQNNEINGPIDNSSQCAVVLGNSENIILTQNTINHGHAGIIVFSSININISENIIHDDYSHGLEISGSSYNIRVANNNIFNNGENGIHIYNSYNNTLKGNIIESNRLNGIHLNKLASQNLITENNITENYRFGICINQTSNNNLIRLNTFTNNKVSNKFDEGFGNDFEANIWVPNATSIPGYEFITSLIAVFVILHKFWKIKLRR